MEMAIDNADDMAFESGYSSDAPTGTPAAAAVPESQAQPASAAAPAAPVDPVTAMMARFDKFEASHNKLAGTLGGLQRTTQELQAAMSTAQAAAKTGKDAPTQGDVKAAMQSPAEWEALKADYPEWATATEKLLESRAPSFDAEAFKAELFERMDGESKATQQRIVTSALNAVMPGWQTEVNSDPFKAWHAAQPADVQALAASDDVGDAARMLKLYEASKSAPAAAPKAITPDPRTKRLAAAVQPRGAGGQFAASSDADEFESGYAGR